jgi:hypothetical protein
MSNHEKGLPPIEVSWSKIDGAWGVRVYGTSADLTGTVVEVTTKDGKASQVRLRELVEERGSARIYAIGDPS